MISHICGTHARPKKSQNSENFSDKFEHLQSLLAANRKSAEIAKAIKEKHFFAAVFSVILNIKKKIKKCTRVVVRQRNFLRKVSVLVSEREREHLNKNLDKKVPIRI